MSEPTRELRVELTASDTELDALQDRVRPTRRALRYFDQVEWDDPSQ